MSVAAHLVETDRLVLAIPPAPEFIAMTRLFAAAVARHSGCDEETIDDVKVAISEAVTNSVKAHSEAGVADPVRVVGLLDVNKNKLLFEVVDLGRGIDMDRVNAASTLTPPGGLYEGSLGLSVVQTLFPSLQILRNDERGTTLRFDVPLAREEG